MNHTHTKTLCKACGTVVSQCRCMNEKVVLYVDTCENCKSKPPKTNEDYKELAKKILAPNVTYIDPKFKEVASWAEELLNAFWVEQQQDLDAFIDTLLTEKDKQREEAVAEARREMLRLVKEECLYPVDIDKEPSIQDEAYANMFESKCEAYWYGEQKANEHFLYNLQTLEDELT